MNLSIEKWEQYCKLFQKYRSWNFLLNLGSLHPRGLISPRFTVSSNEVTLQLRRWHCSKHSPSCAALSEKVVNYFMLKLSFNNSCFCFQFHLIKSGVVVRWFLCHLMCFLCFGKCESISGYLTFFSTAGNWSCGGAPEAAKVRYFGKCESFSGYLFFSTVGNC